MAKIAKSIIIAAAEKVISFKEVAADMIKLMDELKKMPPGQFKKIVANSTVKEIFEKYGVQLS